MVPHAWQMPPFVPHCVADGVWQTPLKQQPEAQVDAPQPVQVLLVQVAGAVQV